MANLIRMPKLGFDMAEGRLVRWVVDEGQVVARGDVIAEIETDKATVEVDVQVAGTVHRHLVEAGAVVPIGTPIAVIGEAGEQIDIEALLGAPVEEKAAAATASAPPEPAPKMPVEEPAGRLPEGIRASPVARQLARQKGLDLGSVRGSGPDGRIVKQDVEAALAGAAPGPPAVTPVTPRQATREPLSKLRAIIGKRMTQAKQQVPHFYVTIDIDAAPLMDLREQFNALHPEEEKLSVNDFIVRAAALNLRRHPELNVSFEGDEIVRHGQVNVGVAVAVEQGLLTVVVRDADVKPLRQIGSETRAMIVRARASRVHPEDIEGSTFTVSNMGMFDVDHFIAIVNPPEAAIMAVGSVRQVPVVKDGDVVVGQRMKVTLSADHRITDGAEAARWLQAFAQLLEQPLQLAIQ